MEFKMSNKETKKELSVDEHNAGLAKEIARLEQMIADIKKDFRSEAEKPQATLQQCLAMNRKAAKLTAVKDKVKPKTNSL